MDSPSTTLDSFVFDLEHETLVPSGRFRELIETILSRPVNQSTVWRWRERGILAKDGQVVRLPYVRVGTSWFSTPSALLWFLARLNAFQEGPIGIEPEPDPAGATAQ